MTNCLIDSFCLSRFTRVIICTEVAEEVDSVSELYQKFGRLVTRQMHARTAPRLHPPLSSSATSERRNGSASETMPTVCVLPRSISFVTVAGLMSMQATRTQAGS